MGSGFREIRRRELGSSQPVSFARRVGGSETLVKRLSLYGKLKGHEGCVNTIFFNSSGDVLISSSDDTQVIFWNWTTKKKRLSYDSGHTDNVFQARVMPFTDDRIVITAAADGQVRLGQISEGGHVNTKRLGTHRGRVHKLAIEPGSPHIFYSCGEDGIVQHFDLRSSCPAGPTKLLMCTSFTESSQPVLLNAIVIDPRNPNYFSVGGSDEYARVYDIRNCQWDSSSDTNQPVNTFCPRHLIGSNSLHITGLAYSNTGELLVSYSDELIYLFQKDMGIGANPSTLTETLPEGPELDQPQVYSGHRNSQTVKGVSFFGPNDEYVASGSDCGHIFIWKKKGGSLLHLLVGDRDIVNCIDPHPHVPFLATSGLESNVKLWMPTAEEPADLPSDIKELMGSNKRGREESSRITVTPDVIMHVLRLQRRSLFHSERRQSDSGGESNEDEDGEAFIVRFTDGEGGPEEGSFTGNPRDCTIC